MAGQDDVLVQLRITAETTVTSRIWIRTEGLWHSAVAINHNIWFLGRKTRPTALQLLVLSHRCRWKGLVKVKADRS